jgi:hypothetical protein
MIRLLRAELRKAARPLVGAVALGLLLAAAAFSWQQQAAASQQVGFVDSSASTQAGITQSAGPPNLPTCDSLGLPPGAQCNDVIARARQAYEAEVAAMKHQALVARTLVRSAAVQQNPLGAGQLAASLLAHSWVRSPSSCWRPVS